jgi:hypothetical protein
MKGVKMNYYEKSKLRSLGKLRRNSCMTAKSPAMVGQLTLQRHTFDAIATQFSDQEGDAVVVNIAAWVNHDALGQYLTTEISPRFVSRQSQPPDRPNLRFVFGDPEDSEN